MTENGRFSMQALYPQSAKIGKNVGDLRPISAVRHIPVLTCAQSPPPPPPSKQEYDIYAGIVYLSTLP